MLDPIGLARVVLAFLVLKTRAGFRLTLDIIQIDTRLISADVMYKPLCIHIRGRPTPPGFTFGLTSADLTNHGGEPVVYGCLAFV